MRIKRPLTDTEAKLRADHRCICCGVSLPVTKHTVASGEVREYWAFECADCHHLREPGNEIGGPVRGKVAMRTEFARRMGTSLTGTAEGADWHGEEP